MAVWSRGRVTEMSTIVYDGGRSPKVKPLKIPLKTTIINDIRQPHFPHELTYTKSAKNPAWIFIFSMFQLFNVFLHNM